MQINLILNGLNQGWIIEKFAKRMQASLSKLGHTVTIQGTPSVSADVNHFMSYNFVTPFDGITSAMITHIDDLYKISHLKKIQKDFQLTSLICMSSFTRDLLIENGLKEDSISYVLPAVDKLPNRKKIKIGLSGRVYPDGRKNEKWLSSIAKKMNLYEFEFHFFGTGWEETAKDLEFSNATIVLHPEKSSFEEDHQEILTSLLNLDYWMYLGFDEGSMGSLDAALAGVALLATPQGFHLNLPGGIDKPVLTEDDLLQEMLKLSEINSLEPGAAEFWTWDRYALEHVKIWEGDYSFQSTPPSEQSSINVYRPSRLSLAIDGLDIVRIRSAIARSKLGLVLRKYIKR